MIVENWLTVFIGKVVSKISTALRFGAGATWPGEVALRLNPDILKTFASQFRKGIIIVAGTNGKTTTSFMITHVLTKQGCSVVHNASGANLENGVVSACIQRASWSGRLDVDYGVFEVDENSLPRVVEECHSGLRAGIHYLKTGSRVKPGMTRSITLVLLNLFRDQLDRYGEVDVIAEKWEKAFLRLDTGNQTIKPYQLIANADDPLVAHLASRAGLEASVTYFGLDDASQFQKKMDHATDSIFCLVCGARLVYEGIYYSHIGIWHCDACGAKRPAPDINQWPSPLPGLYNEYNTLAAVAALRSVGIPDSTIKEPLTGFSPAFGRQEEFAVNGKNMKLFLSKNPAGFNASLRTVLEMKPRTLLFVLNDRIPDGRDVSWIWDVDFEILAQDERKIYVSGDRAYDLALRLKYAGLQSEIQENLELAVKRSMEKTTAGETLFILPTYSAMLEVRKILKGRKIL